MPGRRSPTSLPGGQSRLSCDWRAGGLRKARHVREPSKLDLIQDLKERIKGLRREIKEWQRSDHSPASCLPNVPPDLKAQTSLSSTAPLQPSSLSLHEDGSCESAIRSKSARR